MMDCEKLLNLIGIYKVAGSPYSCQSIMIVIDRK